ncbi:hypothetical protein HMSSN036_55660 [Paenibacillus macerans]|nr:hypothetical protein HMSSN036_55660 [Paenibacillus macerans]
MKWFRQTLCQFELEAEKAGGKNAYDVLNEQAAQIPAGSEGLIVLPYFMGERSPIWDSDAKGTIVDFRWRIPKRIFTGRSWKRLLFL